jgi:O-antigen ligase
MHYSPKISIICCTILILSFTGLVKWIQNYIGNPTLLIFIFSLILCMLYGKFQNILNSNINLHYIATTFLFLLLYIATFYYTYSNYYFKHKILVMVFNLFCMFIPFILIHKKYHLKIMQDVITVLTLLCSIIILYLWVTNNLQTFLDTDNDIFGTPDYLTIGKFIGLGVIISALNISYKNLIFIIFLLLPSLLVLGGRGPIVSCIITITIYHLAGNVKNLTKYILIVFLFSIVYFTFTKYFTESNKFQQRITAIFYDQNAFEGAFRLGIFNDTFQLIKQFPVTGVGIGGFGKVLYNLEEKAYPHNLFLEAYVEGGLMCFLLFSASVYIILNKNDLKQCTKYPTQFRIMYLYILLNYLKSGGFIAARDLFIFGSLCVIETYLNLQPKIYEKTLNKNTMRCPQLGRPKNVSSNS